MITNNKTSIACKVCGIFQFPVHGINCIDFSTVQWLSAVNRTKGCASYRATKHEITLSIVDICLLKVCNNSGELSSPVANSNFLKNRLKNSATIAPSKQCNQALSSILYIRYTIQVIAPLVRVLHGTNMTQTQQCVAWSIYTKQTPQ